MTLLDPLDRRITLGRVGEERANDVGQFVSCEVYEGTGVE
jgi:hypothetical protein